MARLTMTQARGLAELAGQAFEGALDAAERTQREFTRASYRVLGHVPLVAGPARAVERVQQGITTGVYGGIPTGGARRRRRGRGRTRPAAPQGPNRLTSTTRRWLSHVLGLWPSGTSV